MTSLLDYLFTSLSEPNDFAVISLSEGKLALESETENPSLSSESTIGKRVSFAANISQVVSEATYLTPKEKAATFYNGEDQRRFEKARVLAIKEYITYTKKGNKWEEKSETLRGLEDWFQARSKQAVRKEHSARVLREIRRLKSNGKRDDELVRSVCEESSSQSVIRATSLGKADEEALEDNHEPFFQVVEI